MNWEPVKEAIEAEGTALRADPYQQEDALSLCEAAADQWWHRDKEFQVLGIEYRYDIKGWEADSSGVIDLWGRVPEGHLQIVDWKVTRKVDDVWAGREQRSQQLKEYALALLHELGTEEPVLGEFRGISYDDGRCRAVPVVIQPADVSAYERDAQAWSAQRNRLVEVHGWSADWPRNPDGCYAMGPYYPCDVLDACWDGEPCEAPGDLGIRRMSHSSRKHFRTCPEKYRRLTIQKERGIMGKDSDAARLGKLVHAGLAALYKQRG